MARMKRPKPASCHRDDDLPDGLLVVPEGLAVVAGDQLIRIHLTADELRHLAVQLAVAADLQEGLVLHSAGQAIVARTAGSA